MYIIIIIIIRLILSVLLFSLISRCVIHHLLWPDDLFSLLKFGFVGVHWY